MKPIHKFNNSRGATLCNNCKKIIIDGLTDDLYCEEHGGRPKSKYVLVRDNDNKIIRGNDIKWISWKDNGTFEKELQDVEIGSSLVIDFFYGNYTWLTTSVNSILEHRNNFIKFKTKNSIYSLFKN